MPTRPYNHTLTLSRLVYHTGSDEDDHFGSQVLRSPVAEERPKERKITQQRNLLEIIEIGIPDQAADCDGLSIGKPHYSVSAAFGDLRKLSAVRPWRKAGDKTNVRRHAQGDMAIGLHMRIHAQVDSNVLGRSGNTRSVGCPVYIAHIGNLIANEDI